MSFTQTANMTRPDLYFIRKAIEAGCEIQVYSDYRLLAQSNSLNVIEYQLGRLMVEEASILARDSDGNRVGFIDCLYDRSQHPNDTCYVADYGRDDWGQTIMDGYFKENEQ